MRAVVYLRVSTEEQAEKFSLSAQRRACLAHVERQNWVLLSDPFVDDESGRSETRAAYQQVVDLVRRRMVDVVIVHNLDRFMRNLRLLLNFKYELDSYRVRLVSVLDNIDTSTPEGVLQFQIKGAIAEWYSSNLGRETKKGLTEKAQQGLWVGPVPLGYRRGAGGLLELDAQGAEAVRFIFQRYASGIETYTTIADQLNAQGLRTRDGTPFSREGIRTILKNRAYLGEVSSGGQSYPGRHEPLVTPAIWRRCEELRGQRSHGSTRDATHRTEIAWLTGFLWCEVCGRKLWRSVGGRWGRTHRYRCSGHEARVHIGAPHISSHELEQQAMDVFAALTLPGDMRAAVMREARRMFAAETQAGGPEPAAIAAQIERLGEAYADGAINRDRYQRKLAELRRQLDQTPISPVTEMLDEAAAFALLGNLSDLAARASAVERRELLAAVVNRMWVEDRDIIAITPRAELYPLLLAACAAHEAGRGVQMGCLMGLEPTTP